MKILDLLAYTQPKYDNPLQEPITRFEKSDRKYAKEIHAPKIYQHCQSSAAANRDLLFALFEPPRVAAPLPRPRFELELADLPPPLGFERASPFGHAAIKAVRQSTAIVAKRIPLLK